MRHATAFAVALLLALSEAAHAQPRGAPTTYARIAAGPRQLAVTASARADSMVLVAIDSAGGSADAPTFRLAAPTAREWARALQALVNVARDTVGTRRLPEHDPMTPAVALLAAHDDPQARGAVMLAVELPDGALGTELRLRPDDVRVLVRGLVRAIEGDVPADPGHVYQAFEVTRPVRPLPGGCAPPFPEELRRSNSRGEVRASFVVSADGRIEPASFRVISATHLAFGESVRRSLHCMRFAAAELNRQPVRSLAQQAFVFDMQR